MIEPAYIVEFRHRMDGLQNFSWLPQDGLQMREMFLRRFWDAEAEDQGFELLIWDRMEDDSVRFYFTSKEFKLIHAMLMDMDIRGGDKRRGFAQRSEKAKIEARGLMDGDAQSAWVQVDGKWVLEQSRHEAWLVNNRAEARSQKGGSGEN